MNWHKISYAPDMIRAKMAGRKTLTRRVVNGEVADCPNCNNVGYYPEPDGHGGYNQCQCEFCYVTPVSIFNLLDKCPYGIKKDRHWIQENYQILRFGPNDEGRFVFGKYTADDRHFHKQLTEAEWAKLCARKHPFRPTPGRFMYRSLSRLTDEVTGVRVERVQDISEEDAIAEGIHKMEASSLGPARYGPMKEEDGIEYWQCTAKDSFRYLWDSINGKPRKNSVDISWNANPWVWVIKTKAAK